MKIVITTAVWGDWHIDMLNRAMLPSLLAPKNLPAVFKDHEVSYLILTSKEDHDRILSLDSVKKLKEFVDVEIHVASLDAPESSAEHHNWWKTSAEIAAERGAVIVTAHPDVIWSNCSMQNYIHAFQGGKKAIVAPANLRVVSETIVPQIERIGVDLAPAELVQLGLENIHPLTIADCVGTSLVTPAAYRIWPVTGEGFVVAHGSRPVLAYDPSAITLTFKSFVENDCERDDIHFLSNSDDIMFLSLAPLAKDTGLLLKRPWSALDVTRHCSSEFSDSPSNDYTPHTLSFIHTGVRTSRKWHQATSQARKYALEILLYRKVFKLLSYMKELSLHSARKLTIACLQMELLEKKHLRNRKLVILCPSDDGLAAQKFQMKNDPVNRGNEKRLKRFAEQHIYRTKAQAEAKILNYGVKILQETQFESVQILIIDRPLADF